MSSSFRDRLFERPPTETTYLVTPPLTWQAHDTEGFDARMQARCDSLLQVIRDDRTMRQSILANPRDLHKDLFSDFTPPAHPEYAGTYRGTKGTSLEHRKIEAVSQLNEGETYLFIPPNEVADGMKDLLDHLTQWLNDAASDHEKLLGLSYVFCWFGKIHPFLDGNGHVQRAIFAAIAVEFGFPLSSRFAIHPRPYDRLLATALELFTRSPTGEENGELALVGEYLGFFLDGPFQTPRANLLDESPYP
ncbi:Fic family protein [Sphingopyxis sp. 550A]